jgi:hypothetical protein
MSDSYVGKFTSTYNGAGGYTLFNERQNISEAGLYTKDFYKKQLMVAMGG